MSSVFYSYLPLLICISLIICAATAIYAWMKGGKQKEKEKEIQSITHEIPEKEQEMQEIQEIQEMQEMQEMQEPNKSTNRSFRINPQHTIDDESTGNTENFNAPLTGEGKIRKSLEAGDDILNVRHNMTFIEKLENRHPLK